MCSSDLTEPDDPTHVTEEERVEADRPRPAPRPVFRIGSCCGPWIADRTGGARSTPRLRAVELATGRVRWSHDLGWTDSAQVVALADRLFVLADHQLLALA